MTRSSTKLDIVIQYCVYSERAIAFVLPFIIYWKNSSSSFDEKQALFHNIDTDWKQLQHRPATPATIIRIVFADFILAGINKLNTSWISTPPTTITLLKKDNNLI